MISAAAVFSRPLPLKQSKRPRQMRDLRLQANKS
jgi:hypothetical protein